MNVSRWFVLLVLLISGASAGARTISQHSIQIEANETGEAKITELYFFTFESSRELVQLRSEAQKIGADISGWKAFDEQIFPHIGEIKPGTGKIGFVEKEGDRFVKIEYETKKPLFQSVETSRRVRLTLDSAQFASFQTGSVYTIPTNTKIAITIPQQAEFDEEKIAPKPEINYEAKRFVWSGYLNTTGNLELEYHIEKQIAPTIAISKIIQELLPTNEFKLFLAAALLGLGIVYFKRNAIQKKIENYIIMHSSLEKETDYEKIELE